MNDAIPGYSYRQSEVATSPVSLDDLARLKETVMWDEADQYWLRESREVLEDQTEAILDVWYDFVSNTPHLVESFAHADTGAPIEAYLERVRERFKQWILDTADARFDRDWLDYQHEIGLRHHRTKKNKTDAVSASAHIPFRYLVALFYPITATLKPFLAEKGHAPADVDKMHAAWTKAVLLQVILWSHRYVHDGDF